MPGADPSASVCSWTCICLDTSAWGPELTTRTYQVTRARTCSPRHDAAQVTRLRTTLRLQALAYAPAAAPAAELAGSCLVPALLAQLHGAAAVLANRAVAAAASGDGGAAPKRLDGMTAHAFLPPGRSHHVTLLYPEGLPEAAEALELKLTPLRCGAPSQGPKARSALQTGAPPPAPALPQHWCAKGVLFAAPCPDSRACWSAR